MIVVESHVMIKNPIIAMIVDSMLKVVIPH